MRVVIAPDKFKGSLSAPDVAEHLATGLLAGFGHGIQATRIPVADGGEGTIDAAIGSGFTRRTTTVAGPLGEPVHVTREIPRIDGFVTDPRVPALEEELQARLRSA